mgnify:CR=1 FL=1
MSDEQREAMLDEDEFDEDEDFADVEEAEEIAEEYMVPAQSYVSVLTEADVKEATLKDNGKEYEITIVAKDCDNPTAGVGVGAAFDVIETAEISAKTSMISLTANITIAPLSAKLIKKQAK